MFFTARRLQNNNRRRFIKIIDNVIMELVVMRMGLIMFMGKKCLLVLVNACFNMTVVGSRAWPIANDRQISVSNVSTGGYKRNKDISFY